MKKITLKFILIFESLLFCFFTVSCIQRTNKYEAHPQEILSSRTPDSETPPTLISELKETHKFDWPVDSARLTRGFLPNKRRPHLGLDLASPKGTPILSAHKGIVVYRGHDFRGFGRMIVIETGNGWASLYAHLDKFYVEEGQKIRQGELIGAMGRTGRATGVHLHFEIRQGKNPVDPLFFLPGGENIAKHN